MRRIFSAETVCTANEDDYWFEQFRVVEESADIYGAQNPRTVRGSLKRWS
jgi:hypothetical protein